MTFHYVLGAYVIGFIVTAITIAVVDNDEDYLAYIAIGCYWPVMVPGFAIFGLCILTQKTVRAIKRFTSKEPPCPEK